MITSKSIVTRNPELIASSVDDEIVMMNINSGEYFGLDTVGSRIWELIANPVSVEHLINLLVDEFEVSVEQCEQDTIDFLNQLKAKNLILVD